MTPHAEFGKVRKVYNPAVLVTIEEVELILDTFFIMAKKDLPNPMFDVDSLNIIPMRDELVHVVLVVSCLRPLVMHYGANPQLQ